MSDGMRSPRILAVSWGRMEVEGIGAGKDFKLYPGGGRECPAPLAPGHDKACGAISLRRYCPDQVLGVAVQLLRCRLLSRSAARPVSPGSSYGPAPSLASQTYLGCTAQISLPRAGSPAYLDRTSVLRILLHVSGPRLAWHLCAPQVRNGHRGGRSRGVLRGAAPVAVVRGGRVAGSTGFARSPQKGPESSPRVSVSRRFSE